MNGVARSPSDGKKPSNLQSVKKQKTEVFTDGKQYYSYVEPHKLVLNVDVHVRLLLEQEMSNQERSQDRFSAIEPFKVPLPIPPNSKVFNRFQKKLLDKDNTNTEFIKRMTEPIRDSLLSDPRGIKYQVSRIGEPDTENGPSSLDPPNAIPYNAYNLRYISMGYLYEDVWNVEETRPAIAQILLFEDYKELERKRQLKEKQRAQDAEQELLNTPSVVESTATDNSTIEEKERKLELAQRAQEKKAQDEKEKAEEMALDLEDKIGEGDIERANWSTRVVEMYPVVKELKERVYPLWRAISFGHTFDAGRKEIKDCLTNELLVNIILQHMVFERLNRSRKVLEEESRISYQWIDIDESLMHALCKEAIKKSERFFDITIADKIPPRLLQKNKKDISKEMDEMLADFGLEDEGMYGENGKLSGDINIWAETLSQDSQNLIVDSDPVNRSERFLAGSLNVLVEKLTTSVNPSALISTSQVNSSVSGSEEAASSNFALAFLATYMSFTTPDVLLTKLIQRFNIPRGMPDLEMATKKKSIQLSVLQVIRLWLTEHFSHFDNKLLSVLTSFLEEQVETEIHLKKEAGTIMSIIEKKKYDKLADDQPQQQVAKPPEPKISLDRIFNPALSISEIDEEEVARQLTLIEFALFSAIEPQELLNQAWLKVKLRHRAPNLLKLMSHSNEISQWVASVIVTEGMKLDDRKKQLRRFINICNHLFKMNNFNSLKAVLKGLQNMAVARMKQARDSLPSDSKKIQAELEKLMAETNGNYKPYREATRALVKKNDTPMIPYLDVYLSELQLIEVNHNDFTRNPSNNVELINWNKRESSYDVISEIRKMQSRPYNFLPVHQVQQLLIQKKEKIDNQEELKNMSVRAEH